MHVERPLRQSSFLPPFSARLPLRQQFLGRALRVGTDFCWLHRSETKPRRRARRGRRRRGSGATAAMPRRGWGRRVPAACLGPRASRGLWPHDARRPGGPCATCAGLARRHGAARAGEPPLRVLTRGSSASFRKAVFAFF